MHSWVFYLQIEVSNSSYYFCVFGASKYEKRVENSKRRGLLFSGFVTNPCNKSCSLQILVTSRSLISLVNPRWQSYRLSSFKPDTLTNTFQLAVWERKSHCATWTDPTLFLPMTTCLCFTHAASTSASHQRGFDEEEPETRGHERHESRAAAGHHKWPTLSDSECVHQTRTTHSTLRQSQMTGRLSESFVVTCCRF